MSFYSVESGKSYRTSWWRVDDAVDDQSIPISGGSFTLANWEGEGW